jgi:hypothetical protein
MKVNGDQAMPLVHKTVDVRPEVWKKLRLHAEMSGVHLRDYLTHLIEASSPVLAEDDPSKQSLAQAAEANRAESRGQMVI